MTLPIRLGRPSDMAFVIDSWRRAYLDGWPRICGGAPLLAGVDRDHYFDKATVAIKYLCHHGDLHVAHDPKDDDHIVGFASFGGSTFHFAVIKSDFLDDLKVEHLLKDVHLNSYTFRCPYLEVVLDGFRGSHFEEIRTGTGNTIRRWQPPTGWRFTPRI